MDIISKPWLYGCFNYIIKSYDTHVKYPNFMKDVWNLSENLILVLLKHDEKKIQYVDIESTIKTIAIILS